MKKIFALLGIVSASLLIGCGLGQRNAKNREKRDLTLGCVRFNYDEVNNSVAIKDLESMGYKVNVKVLDDALAMNQATIQGEIDASLYQHQPEIDAYNQSQKQNLVMLEPYIHYTVFGMYSDKYHSINDIPQNAKACIPEDSANLARALRLLPLCCDFRQQGCFMDKGSSCRLHKRYNEATNSRSFSGLLCARKYSEQFINKEKENFPVSCTRKFSP